VVEGYVQHLLAGDSEKAWRVFLDQYGRLILAVIRRYHSDYDDVMDAYSHVCEKLSENDLARLRRFEQRGVVNAGFSSWLIVVVRNLVVDGLRQTQGRREHRPAAALSALENELSQLIFHEQRSHAEALEMLRQRSAQPISEKEFHAMLRTVHRFMFQRPGPRNWRQDAPPELEGEAAGPDAAVARQETAEVLAQLLAALPADTRLAVQLFVGEDMPAADVARVVGWNNAKAVYNGVYRALAELNKQLRNRGISRADLD
jgi:RNA polymerase sigma factor (sigma-70 family)